MKATEELKNEHRGVELMLRILTAVSERLGRGEALHTQHMEGIMEFLTIFVDKCHHGKEEEFLFPALEAAGVPREGGPIGVMLSEHEQGRQLVAQLRGFVAGYQPGDQRAGAGIQRIVREYVDLLNQHIAKEDNVLFPMADDRLEARQDAVLFEAFEQLERERIGAGKHEAFHALLDQLQGIYLGD
ncbi:MAG TPA: hemerythrin domain-containing protein [Desulfobacterales bacterium]|jgi:hemerythrin-like domain-containing protein|nr:hemerythrin domain-containing protein [Desulfobacterales bacterium]